jgi:hypothetical protein
MLARLVAAISEHPGFSQHDNVMLRELAMPRVFARSARTCLMVSKGGWRHRECHHDASTDRNNSLVHLRSPFGPPSSYDQ